MLQSNLKSVQQKLDSENISDDRLPSPCIIAVSKKQPVEKIRELQSLGVNNFAENYLQEALEKIEACEDLNICWHFIGRLQSKKIKEIVTHFAWIHTVTRLIEAEKISNVAGELQKNLNVLVQVNIADEDSKQGVDVVELDSFLESVYNLKNINLRGLMVFPPLSETEDESLRWFKEAKNLFDKLKPKFGSNFDSLSMGTSGDYHLAYREGATHLRIGEALMGTRS